MIKNEKDVNLILRRVKGLGFGSVPEKGQKAYKSLLRRAKLLNSEKKYGRSKSAIQSTNYIDAKALRNELFTKERTFKTEIEVHHFF